MNIYNNFSNQFKNQYKNVNNVQKLLDTIDTFVKEKGEKYLNFHIKIQISQ